MSFEEEDPVPPTQAAIDRAHELEHWFMLHGFDHTEVDPDVLGGMCVTAYSEDDLRSVSVFVFNGGAEHVMCRLQRESVACTALNDASMAVALAFLRGNDAPICHHDPSAVGPPPP